MSDTTAPDPTPAGSPDTPGPATPRQLRLILETEDFAQALRFYRDVLGMPERLAFGGEGEDRVAILEAGTATLELATPQHGRMVDRVEGAPDAGPVLRLALEVEDTPAAHAAATAAGAAEIAPPVRTPFRSVNSRVQGPAGWQVTFFQELEDIATRARIAGFATDGDRPGGDGPTGH